MCVRTEHTWKYWYSVPTGTVQARAPGLSPGRLSFTELGDSYDHKVGQLDQQRYDGDDFCSVLDPQLVIRMIKFSMSRAKRTLNMSRNEVNIFRKNIRSLEGGSQ